MKEERLEGLVRNRNNQEWLDSLLLTDIFLD